MGKMRDLFEQGEIPNPFAATGGSIPPPPPEIPPEEQERRRRRRKKRKKRDTRNLAASLAARDEGMAAAEEAADGWFDDRMMNIFHLPKGTEFTGEDLRYRWYDEGIPEPPNPTNHVYGSLIMAASKLRWIKITGERRPMRQKSSHGRKTDVWVRV